MTLIEFVVFPLIIYVIAQKAPMYGKMTNFKMLYMISWPIYAILLKFRDVRHLPLQIL